MQTQYNPILILAPRALLGSLASFEALLVLYMFAGFYKEDPRFTWIPVDPSGLFFALSVIVGTFIILVNPIHKRGLPVVFAMVCLVTWFMVSLLWSPSRLYGPNKVFVMATLELWAVIGGALIIAPAPERVRRLFTLLLLFALWLGVEALLVYAEGGGALQRIKDVGSAGYLMVGRLCGLGALVALMAWLFGASPAAGRLCLVLFFGLGFVLAISGGRGPLLATALPLLILIGLGVRLTTRKILYSRALLSVLALLLAMAGGLALYGTLTEQRMGTIERLEQLMEGNVGSAGARAEHYANASRLWPEAPVLGHGAGSWPLLTGWPDIGIYPHNLFLELLVEGGLVALILFLALLGAAFRSVALERLRRDPQALCAMMLFINTFMNAMVSGDLAGNRAMFMLIGVLALLAVRPTRASTPSAAPLQSAVPLDLSMPARRRVASGRAQPVKTET